MIIRLRWIYGWISAAESMMASMEVRCSLLLRILKVYRTEIHSGYIQYTYRGFHIPRRDAGLVITLQGRVLTFQQPVYRRIRCSMLRRRSTSLMYDDRSSMTAGQRVSEVYREEFAEDRGKTTITFLSSAICQRFVFLNLSERHRSGVGRFQWRDRNLKKKDTASGVLFKRYRPDGMEESGRKI